MNHYVFDSSSLLRFIDRDAGAEIVRSAFCEVAEGRARGCVSALHWGELAGNLVRRFDTGIQKKVQDKLIELGLEVIPATGERAVRAAVIRVVEKLSYAETFAVELAMDSPGHILLTADPAFKVLGNAIRMEFLPEK